MKQPVPIGGGTFSIVLAHRAPARMRVRVLDVCGCGCSTLPLMQNPGVVPRISQGRGLQRGGATGRHERVGSPGVLGSANTHARFARARVASLPGLPPIQRAQPFSARRASSLKRPQTTVARCSWIYLFVDPLFVVAAIFGPFGRRLKSCLTLDARNSAHRPTPEL